MIDDKTEFTIENLRTHHNEIHKFLKKIGCESKLLEENDLDFLIEPKTKNVIFLNIKINEEDLTCTQ
jgi:hypothetical protein